MITTLNINIADTINTIAFNISLTTCDMILPLNTEDTLVGVMNKRASSPLSLSPATEFPNPNIDDMNIVIARTPGNK